MNNETGIALIDTTITDLRQMIEESVKFQTQVSPIYQNIADKILGMLNRQEELDHWEVKDLLKLLELSNKAQLAPVEQLTKLVQSVTALYERSQLQDKVDQLTQIVDEINSKKQNVIEAGQENTYTTIDALD
jgi:hypothetical protein